MSPAQKTRTAVAGACCIGLAQRAAASARSCRQTSQEGKACPDCDDEDCYVIAGTHGSRAILTMRLTTYPRAEDRSGWKPFDVGSATLVRDDPIRRQMEHFGAVVRGEARPLVSAHDGLANLRDTAAVVAAAFVNSTVEKDAGHGLV